MILFLIIATWVTEDLDEPKPQKLALAPPLSEDEGPVSISKREEYPCCYPFRDFLWRKTVSKSRGSSLEESKAGKLKEFSFGDVEFACYVEGFGRQKVSRFRKRDSIDKNYIFLPKGTTASMGLKKSREVSGR